MIVAEVAPNSRSNHYKSEPHPGERFPLKKRAGSRQTTMPKMESDAKRTLATKEGEDIRKPHPRSVHVPRPRKPLHNSPRTSNFFTSILEQGNESPNKPT
ncbi:hypothetical protein GOP47_0020197 [Adiantum capillus-veneris]|uniref:Uncharacterized protein n=1 Tax=Adiantum capillus-veneris TaxID=13818 RepID=A0A9D4UD73_ADICA|nr:hypothetical protein GOP47_0020197 [Adiantum capillus-veneris]